MTDAGELGIAAGSAMPEPFTGRRLAAHDTSHVTGIEE
jgi:hypothetical protein